MTLQRALLLSIALHALLLAIAQPSQQSLPQQASGIPLIARLVEERAERPMPAEVTAEVMQPRAVRKLPKSRLSEQRAVEPPPPEPAPSHEPPANTTPLPAFDPGIVAKYRLEIISAAKQFRRYPPVARENGWQGKAEVRVSFDGARQPALWVSRSSGYAVLDRQALETLTHALAPLPPPLAGRSFELEFPVVFSLED